MSPPIAPLLVAEGIERQFGHVRALKSVNIEVSTGEVVLLAGPNGAGKSTLLRCLAGLARPSRGVVRINGISLRSDSRVRSTVGFLSHNTFLYDDLTARENLRFAADLHGLDRADARVMDALDAAGLTQRADARAGVLSHGMRQRLSIARATLHAPAILLLDEPFSGLDAPAVRELREQAGAGAKAGRAVICVTHQPADLWQIATRIVMLQRGAIAFDITRPTELGDFLAQYDQALAA